MAKRKNPEEFVRILHLFDSVEVNKALDSSADVWLDRPGPGGRGNRAYALRQALALAGERVPPAAELALRAPLKAVAAWMVRRKFLRLDDLPMGWETAKDGTQAHQYLRSAVDAGIAAQDCGGDQAFAQNGNGSRRSQSLWPPRVTMATAVASATAVAQKTAAELYGGNLGALLDDTGAWGSSPLVDALEESAAAQNACAGGRKNRAFALRQALAQAGERVPPASELALRAPLSAVAEWMLHRKYLRHDDVPVGWESAKHGTKAHHYLRSAVDAGIAARGSSELFWNWR
ncbi:hypothetical protein T484DRAFT_1869978 [Baffinella frigidus]|nr:hypothetical protein T484DRAFT_1869978 [Cryptophyta sp. CCMP2293]